MSSKYLVEFIGTFFLVLVIAMAKNPLPVAAVLMVMVYLGGHISGAHYNPAVSTTLFLQKKIDGSTFAKYVITQFLAAMVAAFTYFMISNENFYVTPASNTNIWIAIFLEAIFTFALCATVLQTAVNPKTKGNSYYGLAIGAIVGVAGFTIGPISGAALNPAVGFGPLLVDFNLLQFASDNALIYIAGPLLGALGASLTFSYTEKNK